MVVDTGTGGARALRSKGWETPASMILPRQQSHSGLRSPWGLSGLQLTEDHRRARCVVQTRLQNVLGADPRSSHYAEPRRTRWPGVTLTMERLREQ